MKNWRLRYHIIIGETPPTAACGAEHAKNIDNLIKYICTPIQYIEPAESNRCVKQHLTVNKFILSRGCLSFMMKDLGSDSCTKISSWSGMYKRNKL